MSGPLPDVAMPASTASPPDPSDRFRERLLEQETRRRIFDRVAATPGVHLRRLARELDLSLATVEHQVHQLERNRLVFSHREGRRRSLYVTRGTDPHDVPLLHLLRSQRLRRILLELRASGGLSFRELAARQPQGASTTSHHLNRLVRAHVVHAHRVGRATYYELADAARLNAVLASYGGTFRSLPTAPAKSAPPPVDETFKQILGRLPPLAPRLTLAMPARPRRRRAPVIEP